jgi:TonB family protein
MQIVGKILDKRPARANAPACCLASKKGRIPVRSSLASSALVAAFVLTPVATGYAPGLCQDFSITNQMEPADAWRRDLMRQLQAWWDAHAYYPRHASNNDEGGTVKVHLMIFPYGKVWPINVVESSGSRSLDAAGSGVFRDAVVRPFPEGEQKLEIDLSLHYVLAHRHDQPVAAGYTPVLPKTPFTIMNDPVQSPILETMLKRTCTGTVVRGAVPNHPMFGSRYSAQAIFFRKPDGTPWVEFHSEGSHGGGISISPVTEVGKMLQFAGHVEYGPRGTISLFPQYTVWLDGDNHISGVMGSSHVDSFGLAYNQNAATVDLTCTTEILPVVAGNEWYLDAGIPFAPPPPGDPP